MQKREYSDPFCWFCSLFVTDPAPIPSQDEWAMIDEKSLQNTLKDFVLMTVETDIFCFAYSILL